MPPYFRKDSVSEYVPCKAKQRMIDRFSPAEKYRESKKSWNDSRLIALAFHKNKGIAHSKPSVTFPIRYAMAAYSRG